MPTYRHPLAADDRPGHPPAAVHVSRAVNAEVSGDGTFDAPESVGEAVAARFDLTESDIRESGETHTCAGADGECSREVDSPGGRCWQHAED